MIIKLLSKGGGFFFGEYYSKIGGAVSYGKNPQRHKGLLPIRRIK